jgi:hypothetical protein
MTNIENRGRFDEYWQRWIGTEPLCWPQKACFQSGLAHGLQIELVAVATVAVGERETGGKQSKLPSSEKKTNED